MELSSLLLNKAVNELAKLPGIGKKTSLRLVLHLLKQDEETVLQLSNALSKLRLEVKFCDTCYNISDTNICGICNNTFRNKNQICVVENIRDVIAIESTQQFNGVYHVLGGIISPLDGVGPDELNINTLVNRVQNSDNPELIFALNPTIQGDTTLYFISKKIEKFNCKITTISRGIAFGGELEYADEMTLAKSIQNRIPVNNIMN